MPEDRILYPTGIDAVTGKPVMPPDLDAIAKALRERLEKKPRTQRDFKYPDDLSKAGWGVIFAKGDERENAVRKALRPLLDQRRSQAGVRFHEYREDDGYVGSESALEFLTRHGSGPGMPLFSAPGVPLPEPVPSYLLIVGSPEQIPYEFQYELDHQRAVGRLHFDRLEDYSDYANAVVAAESLTRSSRRVAFFGPRRDPGTEVSTQGLLSPLIDSLRARPDCWVRCLLGEGATKKGLKGLLVDGELPDVLFTAGHGLLYGSGHERQLSHQGALVCQDWPGHESGAPEPSHVFAAEDLNGGPSLQGLMTFLFACNSAGAPRLSDFASNATDLRTVASRAFVSALAQRLLGKGALAVVGHVEQVWQCSFLWRTAGFQPQAFLETMERLLNGFPVGWALEPINQRYSDLAACLGQVLQDHYLGLPGREKSIAELWTACRDARNYVIVGDPAVRLPGKPQKKRILRGMAE
jgi:hypothetical protein